MFPATELARLIGDARLVLLAAGPFGATAPEEPDKFRDLLMNVRASQLAGT